MSKHPISHAFKNYAQENKIKLQDVLNFQSISGKGLIGIINNEKYLIGKKDIFSDLNLDEESKILINENFKNSNDTILKNKYGKTQMYIGTESKILGRIYLKDKLRVDAKDTIESLKIRDIETIMLSGDNEEVAEEVSNILGLDEYHGNLLPEDKLEKIESLALKHGDIAMVGDGVNDTPSLARANVGIAMGIGGADVAIETADIVLMDDKLSKIDQLISIAKKTMFVLKENVFIVIAVKATLVILAVLGHINLLTAIIIGDVGLTLLVVLNSFRIGR
jgi:Cd2+/Zn2+-exporting ATPase